MKKIFVGLAILILMANACTSVPLDGRDGDSQGENQAFDMSDYDYYITNDLDGYLVFHDPESGITFDVPSDATFFEFSKSGESADLISFRIQNYDPAGPERINLAATEYYIELTVDYADESRIDDCQISLPSAETVEANEGTRYMGYPDQGGDSGGERYAICFNGDGPDYYLVITDNNSQHTVRELIKATFFQI